MTALDQLKSLIRTEAHKVACNTHPHICGLRDEEYETLENKVIDAITLAVGEPPSVQTALAELETSLAESE